MDETAEWIAEALVRSDAATTGPWQVCPTSSEGAHGHAVTAEGVTEEPIVAVDWGCPVIEDATFIAAARTDLPKALVALRAILDLHQPTSFVGVQCDEHTCAGTDDEPCSEAGPYGEHEFPSCGACSAPTEDGRMGEFVYPCPTVRRITAALGV